MPPRARSKSPSRSAQRKATAGKRLTATDEKMLDFADAYTKNIDKFRLDDMNSGELIDGLGFALSQNRAKALKSVVTALTIEDLSKVSGIETTKPRGTSAIWAPSPIRTSEGTQRWDLFGSFISTFPNLTELILLNRPLKIPASFAAIIHFCPRLRNLRCTLETPPETADGDVISLPSTEDGFKNLVDLMTPSDEQRDDFTIVVSVMKLFITYDTSRKRGSTPMSVAAGLGATALRLTPLLSKLGDRVPGDAEAQGNQIIHDIAESLILGAAVYFSLAPSVTGLAAFNELRINGKTCKEMATDLGVDLKRAERSARRELGGRSFDWKDTIGELVQTGLSFGQRAALATSNRRALTDGGDGPRRDGGGFLALPWHRDDAPLAENDTDSEDDVPLSELAQRRRG